MASLLTIPLELLIYISSFVSTPDLASLRLACKQTEKSLFEWFSNEFFVKKQFMLTQPSLQVLVDISKHVSLSKRLKHVIIGTDAFDENQHHFRDMEAASRYKKGCADQQALMKTGVDREMLTEAFRNLENLETVDVRDFGARRPRDGSRWTSWGSTTVFKETNISLLSPYHGAQTRPQLVSHMFTTIIYALGKADRMLPRFEVLLRRPNGGLPDNSFHIADFMHPTCRPVLQNLTTLLLALDLTHEPVYASYNNASAPSMSGLSLRRFLGYTRNLTHLRLNFRMNQIGPNEDFLKWLGQPVVSSSSVSNGDPAQSSAAFLDPAPIDLPMLKELDFGNLRVDNRDLIAIIAKFSSQLEALSLWRMIIHRNSTAAANANHNLWFDVFKSLENTLKLNTLRMNTLSQVCGDYNHFITETGDSHRGQAVEYSGKTLTKFFTELEDHMPADWPDMRRYDSDHSNSDDENSEDDYDDGDGEEESGSDEDEE